MKRIGTIFLAGVLIGFTPVFAADLGASAPAAAPAAKPVIDTVGIELSPEWGALAPNPYKDTVGKLSFSHSLGNGWSLGASLAETVKPTPNVSTWQPEVTLGYKWKLDAITLGLSGGLGYISAGVASSNGPGDTYYLFNATADLKLSSQWTWNAISARYRNAFDYTWVTPKLTTGFTYAIDGHNSTYANVGYSWKDTGAGLKADKVDFAVGYKYGF